MGMQNNNENIFQVFQKTEGGYLENIYYNNTFTVKQRKRTSKQQKEVLEHVFTQTPKPDTLTRKSLGVQLNMTVREVQVWFQNRRAKVKKLANGSSHYDLHEEEEEMFAPINTPRNSYKVAQNRNYQSVGDIHTMASNGSHNEPYKYVFGDVMPATDKLENEWVRPGDVYKYNIGTGNGDNSQFEMTHEDF